MKSISLLEIKQALKDSRFRDVLPKSFSEDIQKYLNNPGCACNTPFYRKIIQECPKQLQEYFPGRTIPDLEKEFKELSQNNWQVINCHINELETELKKLGAGRKQLAISRYEDQVTVIVNHLDLIF